MQAVQDKQVESVKVGITEAWTDSRNRWGGAKQHAVADVTFVSSRGVESGVSMCGRDIRVLSERSFRPDGVQACKACAKKAEQNKQTERGLPMTSQTTADQTYAVQIMQIIREAAGQPVIGAAIASRLGEDYKRVEITLERLREEGKVAYNYRGWSEPKTDLYVYSQENDGVLVEDIDVRFAKPLTLAEAREKCQEFAELGGSTLVDVKPAVPGVESPTRREAADAIRTAEAIQARGPVEDEGEQLEPGEEDENGDVPVPEAEEAADVASELSMAERETVDELKLALEDLKRPVALTLTVEDLRKIEMALREKAKRDESSAARRKAAYQREHHKRYAQEYSVLADVIKDRASEGRRPKARTFNHRDFWTSGHGAKGLDPSIMTIYDRIEMDDGSTRPSFSKWAYAKDQPAPYPMRELPLVQRDAINRVANDNCSQAAFFMASEVRQTKDGAVHGRIGYDNGVCRPREVVFYANGDVWFGA